MKKALVLLAQGSEETEAVVVIDLLRRANIEVVCASLDEQKKVQCSRGVVIWTDKTLSEIIDIDFDVVVLPGGVQGANNLNHSQVVIDKLRKTHSRGALIAAICAAPAVVLTHPQLFPKAVMTGYPSTKSAIEYWCGDRVHFDSNFRLITSQGPATSFDFALKIIEVLLGRPEAHRVASQLVLPSGIDGYS